MAWISLFLIFLSVHAADLPRFLTKHSPETLRFISMDGRYAYVKKKPGVLGLVNNFRSVDFLSEPNANDFLVKGSSSKKRLVIESIPNAHDQLNLLKNHRLYVVDYGNSVTREIGQGRGARLHLKDEWITYYNVGTRTLFVENLLTKKKFEVRLSPKDNPFFIPEAVMISPDVILYSDINQSGHSALVSYNLSTGKSSIMYKSSQTASRLELCSSADYAAIGEFPYDGVDRGSSIQFIKIGGFSGTTTIYSSVEQDIGNMVCLPDSIYFVKTVNHDKHLNFKTTEAVNLNLKTHELKAKSELKNVSQLIEMDGRVLIPLRGEFYVLEGRSNLGEDVLKSMPKKEELQIDL